MELRQLLTFQTVVRSGSLLQAAKELQYAQSTITLHIQQLESELGVKLFMRQGRRLQLTPAGSHLRDSAEHLLQEAVQIQQTMQQLAQGESGHICLGAIEPTASLRLPALLVQFFSSRPRVRLTVEVGGTLGISGQVASGKLDLGICSPPPIHLGLHFEPLFHEALVLLVPRAHPLADSHYVTPDHLEGQRLLLTERHCAYRELTERTLVESGANPYSGIEIGSLEALKHAVQQGLGIALLPAIGVSPPPEGTVVRAIQNVELTLPVGLIQRREQSPAGRIQEIFLHELRERLCELPVPVERDQLVRNALEDGRCQQP